MGYMFHKNKKARQQYRSSADGTFRRGNATPSRAQLIERSQRQAATDRQLGIAQRLAQHRRRIRIVLTCLIVIAGILFWRSTIADTKVTSAQKLSVQQEQTYKKYIQGRVGDYSIARQGWSLDTKALSADVSKHFPEIENIKLSTANPFLTIAQAAIAFREPAFMWQDASGKIRYIDRSGVLFDQNNSTVGVKQLTTIRDESGLAPHAGQPVISETTSAMISQIPKQLKLLYPKGVKAIVLPKSTRELRVELNGAPYYIKLSTERSLAEQVGELQILSNRLLKPKGITPRQYIYLRLAHKVFYR